MALTCRSSTCEAPASTGHTAATSRAAPPEGGVGGAPEPLMRGGCQALNAVC
eukprot:CAMPEP_0202417980 /NCGR_PEP_ID=MMETSP1128-20130828/44744_1 /ASSEMBLY_ACC=CAM_ASM_000463 /TAXON_ID=3047 /ORGANISM="Dunaliella tertiolecta, Strain CCMP1320" /LENGTH=51 /DNA_ID=CAMNT_0049025463 /DNA_START=91 /DNA_END=244 /DNA_ORIENTATION=+